MFENSFILTSEQWIDPIISSLLKNSKTLKKCNVYEKYYSASWSFPMNQESSHLFTIIKYIFIKLLLICNVYQYFGDPVQHFDTGVQWDIITCQQLSSSWENMMCARLGKFSSYFQTWNPLQTANTTHDMNICSNSSYLNVFGKLLPTPISRLSDQCYTLS